MAFLRNQKYVHRSFLRRGIFNRLKSKAVFFNKSSYLSHEFAVDRKVKVYNGMKFIGIFLRSSMANHAIGEFCLTKRQGTEIHSLGKKGKKKKK